MFVAAVQTGPM